MARDAKSTKRRLLGAAADEFAQRGIAGPRMDRIAAIANTAGNGRGTERGQRAGRATP